MENEQEFRVAAWVTHTDTTIRTFLVTVHTSLPLSQLPYLRTQSLTRATEFPIA